jgi:hypothetical protein
LEEVVDTKIQSWFSRLSLHFTHQLSEETNPQRILRYESTGSSCGVRLLAKRKSKSKMDEELVKSEFFPYIHYAPVLLITSPLMTITPEYASHVERTGWILAFWGMLTQVSNFGFPSYNVALGFWGAYCSFSKHGRATFGLITQLSSSSISLVSDTFAFSFSRFS